MRERARRTVREARAQEPGSSINVVWRSVRSWETRGARAVAPGIAEVRLWGRMAKLLLRRGAPGRTSRDERRPKRSANRPMRMLARTDPIAATARSRPIWAGESPSSVSMAARTTLVEP
jgi:hypothetical protein